MFPHFKVSLRHLENGFMVAWGGDGGKDSWGAGIVMYTLLYLKWITTGSAAGHREPCSVLMWQPGWEGSLEGMDYMCVDG